ncbi:MAG: glycosyltransferase family 2 protein [Pseudomonadota bacterium]
MKWGVCTTAKAPLPQLLAFVAWHKHLGADNIWVHLDDADPVSANVLGQIDGVTPVLCDDAYWAVKGDRPRRQEPRQSYNVQRVYGLTYLPFLAHVDVDEYILPSRPVADILDDFKSSDPYISMRPAEALHDADLPDDIFTARQFRLPFPPKMPDVQKRAVLGEFAEVLPRNVLSHQVGKAIFRTGLAGFKPKLHAGTWEGEDHIRVGKHPELLVLHFHAQNRKEWHAALPHRVRDGAYRFNEPLAAYLGGATQEEVERFYDHTQVAQEPLLSALDAHGLLVEAELRLKEKVEALF